MEYKTTPKLYYFVQMEPADKQQLLQTGPDSMMKQHSGGE